MIGLPCDAMLEDGVCRLTLAGRRASGEIRQRVPSFGPEWLAVFLSPLSHSPAPRPMEGLVRNTSPRSSWPRTSHSMQRNPTADGRRHQSQVCLSKNRIMAKRPSKRPAATACPWDNTGDGRGLCFQVDAPLAPTGTSGCYGQR